MAQIELKNVSKKFDKNHVLEHLSLSIEAGERIAIIGPSGCGKSTLLRLIMGLHIPDSGDVLVEEQSVPNMTDDQLRQFRLKFGFVFQSSALFDSMSVYDNVAFSLRENLMLSERKIKDIVHNLLAAVEMEHTGHKMPADLSGGMRRRIGLARALAAKPEIVLYDEPTAGLDPILSSNIESLMIKLNHQLNCTSIVVTHQVSTILATADKIYMLSNGHLLPPETPETIMNSQNETIRNFIHGGRQA